MWYDASWEEWLGINHSLFLRYVTCTLEILMLTIRGKIGFESLWKARSLNNFGADWQNRLFSCSLIGEAGGIWTLAHKMTLEIHSNMHACEEIC